MRRTKKRKNKSTTFVDLQDRVWAIEFTPELLAEIRVKNGVDLSVLSAEPFGELAADIEMVVRVLWLCVAEQAVAAGVTPVQFAENLGRQIVPAAAALGAALKQYHRKRLFG